jgi:predicted amidohydrolase
LAKNAAPDGSRPTVERFGIAALQLDLTQGDNVALIAAEVDAVKSLMPWVQMVVLGELAAFGSDRARAEALPGPTEKRFCDMARHNEVWLVPGSLYERRGDVTFNTTPVIDPSGSVVTRYRKQFPFYPYEKEVAAGTESVVFDVPGVGRFGVSICYDMSFPETTRSLCSMGAEVIVHPTLTYTIDRDVELAIARASAAMNQCYVVDVNASGELGNGRSIICGPGGEVIHAAGYGREIITLEVDLTYLRNVRERGWHCLGQQLKSFRDSRVVFPAYNAGAAASDYLSGLGSLTIPGTDSGTDTT